MSRLDFTDPATLAALTDMLMTAGVDGLEITTPDVQLKLVIATPKNNATKVSRASAQPAAAMSTVKAPLAGCFYFGSDHGETYPRSVAADAVIGFVRVGHVLVPVKAERAGVLTRRLAGQDALVGFGDPLFEIEFHA